MLLYPWYHLKLEMSERIENFGIANETHDQRFTLTDGFLMM